MTVLLITETVLLVLVLVLVAGLLRSHAEVLRRLGPEAEDREQVTPNGAGPGQTISAARPAATSPASELAGQTPDGGAVKLVLGGRGPTLLAFLSSGCQACEALWSDLRADEGTPGLPGGARVVVVAQDAQGESPAQIARLAGEHTTVLMSTAAWQRYGVSASPYFVYLDSGGGPVGEGTAASWTELRSLISNALADVYGHDAQPAGDSARGGPAGEPAVGAPAPARSGADRGRRVDGALAAAGIGPGHPSLYPSGDPPDAGSGHQDAAGRHG